MRHSWLLLVLLWACNNSRKISRKIYSAPAMGAEAQFDKGLRPEKHPQYLFDKKTMKDMEQQGVVTSYTGKRHSLAPRVVVVKNTTGAYYMGQDSATRRPDSTAVKAKADSARTGH